MNVGTFYHLLALSGAEFITGECVSLVFSICSPLLVAVLQMHFLDISSKNCETPQRFDKQAQIIFWIFQMGGGRMTKRQKQDCR